MRTLDLHDAGVKAGFRRRKFSVPREQVKNLVYSRGYALCYKPVSSVSKYSNAFV